MTTLREDLATLTANGWEHWRFGEPDRPAVGEVFVRQWPQRRSWPRCADVLVLIPGRRLFADAWRARVTEDTDVFTPRVIDWAFGGTPSVALARLLALSEPYSSAAPHWGQALPGARVPLPWLQGPHHRVCPLPNRQDRDPPSSRDQEIPRPSTESVPLIQPASQGPEQPAIPKGQKR